MTYAPQALDGSIPRDFCLGVDLGTTFVAAAICDGTRPEMVTLGGRSVVMPSAVYLDEDGRLLCGEAAVHRSVSEPTRAARGFFKRRLGDPTPLRMGGQTRSVTELLAALLDEVLRVVTELEGAAPARVMLTHPANWGPLRRQVFAEVAALAGLGSVPTTTEPEAAAAHYAASRELPDGRLMAVYDLGGGTFDATVLRARRGGVQIVGAPEGIERLGGIDFDNALFTHLDLLCDGALSSLDGNDPRAAVTLARLEQDIVLAKEHLSVDARARVPLFLPGGTFDVVLTRSVFEDLIRAHVESTVVALLRTLHSAAVTVDELDAILLVGGSSRIPLVAQMLTEALGRPVAVDTHPKYAVALGAATLAAQMPTAASAAPDRAVITTTGTVVRAFTRPRLVGAGRGSSGLTGVGGMSPPPRGGRALMVAGGGSGDVRSGSASGSGGDRRGDPWDDAQTEVFAAGSVVSLREVDPSGAAEPEGPAEDGSGGRTGAGAGSALVLVTAGGVPVGAGRSSTRVPVKMVAAAVALLSTGAVGFWAHRSGETTPVVDTAAGPAQSCDGDCLSALGPSPATQPSARPPDSSTAADGFAAALPPSGTTRAPGRSSSTPPGRARTATPVYPLGAPSDEDVAAQRTAGSRLTPDPAPGAKSGAEKKSAKRSADKKSTGKHKSGSDSSPILGGIV